MRSGICCSGPGDGRWPRLARSGARERNGKALHHGDTEGGVRLSAISYALLFRSRVAQANSRFPSTPLRAGSPASAALGVGMTSLKGLLFPEVADITSR